jgi:tetratricopeptide (TPR) repeat protein
MGVAYYSLGKHKEAITCFDKALELDQDHRLATMSKGITLFLLNEYNSALGYFVKYLNVNPDDPTILNFMSSTLHHLGDNEQALECANKSITINPNDAIIWYFMGYIYFILNEHDSALRCFVQYNVKSGQSKPQEPSYTAPSITSKKMEAHLNQTGFNAIFAAMNSRDTFTEEPFRP